jgi:hypothetical protein
MLCERQQGPGHGSIQLPRELQDQLKGRGRAADFEAAFFRPLNPNE